MSVFIAELARLSRPERARLRTPDAVLPATLQRAIPEGEDTAPYAVVAYLAALVPYWQEEPAGNMGETMRRLDQAAPHTGFEPRFSQLLVEDSYEGLAHRLAHTAKAAHTHKVPINWTRLLADLRGWLEPNRPVQRAWAQAFWAGTEAPPETMTLAEAAASLGIAPATLRVLANRGTLQAVRTETTRGPTWTVTPEEVERYRRDHLGKHGPKPRTPR